MLKLKDFTYMFYIPRMTEITFSTNAFYNFQVNWWQKTNQAPDGMHITLKYPVWSTKRIYFRAYQIYAKKNIEQYKGIWRKPFVCDNVIIITIDLLCELN